MEQPKPVEEDSSERPTRHRHLTEKGKENFQHLRNEHLHKLNDNWKEIENLLSSFHQISHGDITSYKTLEKSINLKYREYRKLNSNFKEFLRRHGETEEDLKTNEPIFSKREDTLKQTLDNIHEIISETSQSSSKSSSIHGSKSIASRMSNRSSVITQKLAEAEAARLKVEFAKKETELKKKQAHAELNKAMLDAEIDLLRQEKEAAAMEAEVRVLQSANSGSSNSATNHINIGLPQESPTDRTKQYVEKHSTSLTLENQHDIQLNDKSGTQQQYTPAPDKIAPVHLNLSAHPFIPRDQSAPNNHPNDSVVASELTRFLLKKDLLLSRLTRFNDQPENYAMWKSSFKIIMHDLEVTESEELDLLVKWLGPESSRTAISLRTSNVFNPMRGLQRAWERLDERFGSPERVEAALKLKLSSFPKLSNRDYRKLYELSDIIAEIESVKEDPKYSSVFAYLDSSSGIKPIISKLPYGIQEKWASDAINFKRRNNVCFPPFSFFANFIRDVSLFKNDPSFLYDSPQMSQPKREMPFHRTKQTILCSKTDVQNGRQSSSHITNPKTHCPIHKSKHTLNQCRGFRFKPIQDRRKLLKDLGICYRCCEADDHMADKCEANILCKDCGSSKHPTALHQTQANIHEPPNKHGGEKPEQPVNTKCTQVCGQTFGSKSCGKTILVKVYPKDNPENSIQTYAILDDQSNTTLASPELFDALNIHTDTITYTLSSCAGLVNTTGKQAIGLMVENTDGSFKLKLPTVIECAQIPDIRDEIPTPEVALHHTHLRDIARFIPPIQSDTPILLLIGRDAPELHHVLEQLTGPHNAPYAQLLPLGWTIIGESCLGNFHRPKLINTNKTHMLTNGRPSICEPCPITHVRFLWYKNNDLEQELVEYRMCVHVFGNSPSPAVAAYGLRKSVQQTDVSEDVQHFVSNNFYVDDALISLPTTSQAIDLLQRTKQALDTGGKLRLHKFASNSSEVMSAFPQHDLAKEIKDIDLHSQNLPLQRSLGVTWDLHGDFFTFQVSTESKPFTRRGILSTVNSLYDPLGFASPVTIKGKILLRELMASTKSWDEPLDDEYQDLWETWRLSLNDLETLKIPRPYTSISLQEIAKTEIHIFSDASEKAIAAVAYLRTEDFQHNTTFSFILGKAKIAPSHCHTIPRLELCAAVLAVEISNVINDQLDIQVHLTRFHTDSKVVLGYINNDSRRFYIYVSNRVAKIRKWTNPEQWEYVPSHLNPADQATRSLSAKQLGQSMWLSGPPQTPTVETQNPLPDPVYPLQLPDDDKEIRPQATVLATGTSLHSELVHKFSRSSDWNRLVNSIALLRHIAKSYKSKTEDCKGWHICKHYLEPDNISSTETFILQHLQQHAFATEIACIKHNKPLPRNSHINDLNPTIDTNGLLVVGGRLNKADLPLQEKNPLIIPGRHHVATLLVRHCHEQVQPQGRTFTEGAIRSSGYWIIGGKRLISSVLHKCVKCRKLRGKQQHQQMADLPDSRLQVAPPFSYVGVDTFGPWSIVTRKTRGGQACSKRWAVLFTCMSTRAIHIEVVEELSSSSFINALRRFFAFRGPVKEFRSDRGTNFVGSTDILNIEAVNIEDTPVKNFLNSNKTRWLFNPPHASHMGGAGERLIGVTRKILDSLHTTPQKHLTHEVLSTFMAEVCAIVNSRPITPVSTDPENPSILSPAILLTQKTFQTSTCDFQSLDLKDMYKAQWKRVQALAEMFWNRWRREYLHNLQSRRKWKDVQPNVKAGDIVLMKDKELSRIEWPMGVIKRVFTSSDTKVRSVEVKIIKNGVGTVYTRPISELVLLISD